MSKIGVHISLFLVSLLYAILFSWAGQIMPNYLTPEAFVWLRIIVAALLFNVLGFFVGREKIDIKSDGFLFLVCAFFGTSANMLMFFKGLSLTKPINGAVLMMVTPMFVAIIDHIRNRKQPTINTILGLLIGTIGAILLISSNGIHFSSATLIGDIWVAVNAAFYAVYLVYVKKLVHKYKPITVNRITFGIGVLLIAPFGATSLVTANFSAIPTDIWLKIGYTLIFTSFLVYLLNAYGVKHGSPSLVGIYIYLQPILATLIAVFLGRDNITVEKLFLIAMVLFGVWLVLTSDKRVLSFKNRLGE